MPKPVFFYATGTAFFTEILGIRVSPIGGGVNIHLERNGNKYYWNGAVTNDPFYRVLDPQIWDSRKIEYPAAVFPMGTSIDIGVANVISQINNLPAGTPFALGGYSQGASVMSKVYTQIRSGSLTSRAASFKGGVMFGNPSRQQDFLAPGLTWSGSWDVPGSTTGGHGCFPASLRLTGCEYGKWREYVNEREVITSVGNSAKGTAFCNLVGYLTGQLDPVASIAALLDVNWINALGDAVAVTDFGHVAYPWFPPPCSPGVTYPPTQASGYELAYQFLDSIATAENVGPILPITHPSMNKTWTTCRTFPA